ncbi:MAG: hypothetical protein IJT94_10500, partial [Oscillibacter sp.]|nr:hypothetical protein [Oscillibacter sp.]
MKEPNIRFTDELDMAPFRLWILAAFMAAVMVVYFCVLADTQINHHEEYLAQSVHSIVRYETVKSSRGIITDRNGRTLISNGYTYDLTFDETLLKKDQDPNDAILRLIRLCISQDRGWTDTLPVTWSQPHVFTVDGLSREQKRLFLNYLTNLRESRDLLAKYLEDHRDLVEEEAAPEAEENLPQTGETEDTVITPTPEAMEGVEQAAAGEEATALNEDAAEALGRDAPSDGETEEGGDGASETEEEKPGLMDRLNAFLGRDKEEEPVLASGRKLLEQLKPEQLSAALLLDAGIDADDFLLWMGREFKIPAAYTDAERRSVAGVQYELIMRRLGDNSVYVLTHNVDTEFLSLLADGGYSGYKLINSSVRQYATDAAAHILGTVGKLVKEDLEDPKYDGYPLDAVVGRSGVEAAFEEYLHGIDGRRVLSVSEDGVITGEYYSKEPQPGSTVELTIDLDFQEAVEAALKDTVVSMTEADHQVRGAGAAVVRVGTGEILALASYPTFTLNEYRNNFYELRDDPTKPLLNRATSGLYPPGSTLKPATAVCALM